MLIYEVTNKFTMRRVFVLSTLCVTTDNKSTIFNEKTIFNTKL